MIISPPPRLLREAAAEGGLVLLLFLDIFRLTVSVRPISSRSTGPIFTKFLGLVMMMMAVDDHFQICFSISQGR